ncbi:MAG: DUF2608 domain-containing protein [Parachlamydiaceae bacterium]|nr:DUF2608 domain-containing protein [Parachlamydiaceae bacterium]
MKNIWIFFFLLINLFIFCSLNSEIIETSEIETVLQYVNKDSLVLFNVSDTLYEPSTTIAEHAWREYFAEKVIQLIKDPELGQKLINKTKNKIVQNVPKKLVEGITPTIISELQQRRLVVLGITEKKVSTPYAENFSLITSNHLQGLGIDLNKTLIYFDATEKDDNAPTFSLQYGILFSNKKGIGPSIKSFMEYYKFNPQRIVMIDNSMKSLKVVETLSHENSIEFNGLRYTRTDDRKANYDPVLGIIEFDAFINEHRVMSDQEALQIKLSNPDANYEVFLENLILKMSLSDI